MCQRVRDPAHGFFVAGSSLPSLNGIYGRVRNEHVQFLSGIGRHSPVRLAYRHDKTGWLMVLVDISPEERPTVTKTMPMSDMASRSPAICEFL